MNIIRIIKKVLLDDNIVPEELPPEEDINKLKSRIKSNEKKLEKESRKKIRINNEKTTIKN